MELIIGTGTVVQASRDTMPATGTPGWATDGDPAATIPATDFPASHYNMLVAEVVQVIIDAGLDLDRTNWGQMSTAIKLLISAAITSSAPVSGIAGVNPAAGDKQGTSLYFAGGIAKMFAQYDGGNGALAWANDVTTVNTNLTAAVTNQANINAGFSADISDCVSGVDGVNSSAGDKQGTALYFAGGIAKMFAQYDGGNGALAWSNDVTVVNSNLVAAVANQSDVNAGFSADISDRVSGTDGLNASAGDKQGTALYFAGAIVKMFAAYDGGSGALAWSNDVDAVNTSLASALASQSNINAGFSADISDCVSGTVGMSQSGDLQMRGLCMRYSANNGNGLYPYATYRDGSGNTNNLPLVQSNAGTGFSVIYNAKMQYVSASEGYLWVDYVGGGSAKFVSADCGVIPASLDSNGYGCAGGTWELNGNVLTQSFVWIGEGNTAVSFYKEFSGAPVLNLSINEEANGTSRTPNINTNSDGTPNVSTTGFSFQPVFVASQAGTSTALFHLNVTAKGVAA